MAGKLKRPVELQREVVAISSNEQGAEVHCVDGSIYKARRVICSLPYSVLRNIRFDPLLNGAHAIAVSSLTYMINTIIFFKANRPFWEDDGLSPTMWTDGMLGTVFAQRFGETDEEVTAISVNPRGIWAAYLDRLPREEAIRRVIAEIEKIRPKARGALECTGYHSWNQDPFSAGDWAIFAPGQISRFGNAMAQVHGNVHFCGEHTAVANRGMEGAMESAERAAIEVMTAL
jgi:monoamine oxidase